MTRVPPLTRDTRSDATGPAPSRKVQPDSMGLVGVPRSGPLRSLRSPGVEISGTGTPRAPPGRAETTHQLSARLLGKGSGDLGDSGGAGVVTSRGGASAQA